MELSLDTSSNLAGIALSYEGEMFAEYTWKTARNHSTELVPRIETLIKQHNREMKSCTAIFAATGPGSFNGLRVGLSAAKGFALSLSVPLIGINTLEIEAYPFAWSERPVCAIHNAGREEIAAALYSQSGGWHEIKKPHITTITELCRQITEPTVFCGETLPGMIDQLSTVLGRNAVIPPDVCRIRRTSCLAHLGWKRFIRNDFDDPAALQPLYLRQPPITQRKIKQKQQ